METKFDIDPKLVENLSKCIKTEKDLAALSKFLLKLTIEHAMSAEMDEHLGYDKHASEGKNTGNSRNGHSKKTIKGDFGQVDIKTPRDRNATSYYLSIKRKELGISSNPDKNYLSPLSA